MTDHRLTELAQLPLQQRAARIAELFADGVDDQQPPPPSRSQRRAARNRALAEKPALALRRFVMSCRHWLAPAKAQGLAAVIGRLALDGLLGGYHPNAAMRVLSNPEGFCGRALSLAPHDLIELYAQGANPRNVFGVTTLWSPETRLVLRPWDFPRGADDHSSEDADHVSLDENFDRALALCAAKIDVWHSPRLHQALGDLYDAGFAHSLEVHDRSGALIASLIGVASGGVFCVERSWAVNDKALLRGVNSLVSQLQRWNFTALDFTATPDLASAVGCGRLSRAAFAEELAAAACSGRHGPWRIAEDLRRLNRRPAPSALEFLARAQNAA